MVVSTRFPAYADMKMLLATGVRKVCFFGKVMDPETVKLVNAYTESNPNNLEIVKLETGPSSPLPG